MMDMLTPKPNGPISGDILVVEDNAASMKLLAGILIEAGYKVRPALDGELALRSIEVKKPDLILLDFHLPGQDGLTICRHLKNDPNTCDIPIIFISSISSSELKVKSLGAGAVDYVTKPIDPPEVLARIANHLELYRMQKQLAEQAAELEMHRQRLEELVIEKTHELRSSEEKFRNLFQTSMDSIMVMDVESGKLTDVNKSCEILYGYSREEFLELGITDISRDPEKSKLAIASTIKSTLTHIPERIHKKKDGTVFPVEATTGKFSVGNKNFMYAIIRDISRRRESEEKIQASLREKEVLLREIHHRVKNNMQVIVSLLRLHSRRTQNEQVNQVFDECRDRINAMSLIHEALYESRNVSQIDFSSYLKKLCRHLNQAYGRSAQIETLVAPSQVWLGMDQGIAVGMVVCELVSNSFKHAFTENSQGSISIQLEPLADQKVQLTVYDDGVGLPEDVDIQAPQSLGLELAVSAITRELGGTIEVDREKGTKFIIRFECAEHEEVEN